MRYVVYSMVYYSQALNGNALPRELKGGGVGSFVSASGLGTRSYMTLFHSEPTPVCTQATRLDVVRPARGWLA